MSNLDQKVEIKLTQIEVSYLDIIHWDFLGWIIKKTFVHNEMTTVRNYVVIHNTKH